MKVADDIACGLVHASRQPYAFSRHLFASSARRLLLAAAVACCSVPASAQETFPRQSIEMIVPWGAGGMFDLVSRKLAPLLGNVLGVEVEVVNVPGATGNAGLTRMLMNPADGYTMTVIGPSTISSWEMGVGFARVEDLRVIAFVTETPAALFVRNDSPFKTLRELLDYAKANPETLRLSSWGHGTPDITLRELASKGYKLIDMPFAKAEQRIATLLGRRADVLYELPVAVAELLRSGRIRPLAVLHSQRDERFPEVPSVSELGFEAAAMPVFLTIVVNAKTPPERSAVLADAIAKTIGTPEWKEYCAPQRTCAQQYTPEQVESKLRSFRDTVRRYSQVLPR